MYVKLLGKERKRGSLKIHHILSLKSTNEQKYYIDQSYPIIQKSHPLCNTVFTSFDYCCSAIRMGEVEDQIQIRGF
jgi:hypothetical protein